jgi:hypothetical protein
VHINNGSDNRMPIVIEKSVEPQFLINVKKLPVTCYANSKVWMMSEILRAILYTLDASYDALSRKIIIFVHNCASPTPDTSYLRNIMWFFTPKTAPML